MGVGVAVGAGVGVAVGAGVGVAVGAGMGVGVAVGAGMGVAAGVGAGVGAAVGAMVGVRCEVCLATSAATPASMVAWHLASASSVARTPAPTVAPTSGVGPVSSAGQAVSSARTDATSRAIAHSATAFEAVRRTLWPPRSWLDNTDSAGNGTHAKRRLCYIQRELCIRPVTFASFRPAVDHPRKSCGYRRPSS